MSVPSGGDDRRGVRPAPGDAPAPFDDAIAYVGTELLVFALADNWKAYFRSFIQPVLRGDVLEVGAGLGATTRALCDGTQTSWLCLEPDPELAREIEARITAGALPAICRVAETTLRALPPEQAFDCILYIDVLEHIVDDAAEARGAAARLRAGGHLVIVAPAHPCLFSRFDAAIGHHRRYTRSSLSAIIPPGLGRRLLVQLDALGTATSAVNRWLLRQSNPTARQILFWDRGLVPWSRRLDRLLRYRLGRSLVGVWRLEGAAPTPAGER